MYKNFIYFSICLFLVLSCSQENTQKEKTKTSDNLINDNNDKPSGKQINISGIINNPIKGALSLEVMTGNQFSLVKPINLKGEKFQISVNVAEPDMYRINLYDKQYIYLILNQDDIKIEVDASIENLPYAVKGSKDTDIFNEVNRLQQALKSKNDSLAKKLEAGGNRENLIKTFAKFENEHVKAIKLLIENSKPSIAMYFALSTANPDNHFSLWEKTLGILQKNFPDSKYTKALATRVEVSKKTAIGTKVPDITLKNIEGKVVKLSSLKSKFVLIDFWASWCRPCRAENPILTAVYHKYKNKGLDIYGISIDKNTNAWRKAIEQDKLTWTQVVDPNDKFSAQLNVQSIPKNFLVDASGKIVAKNLRGSKLEDKISELLD